MRASSLSYKVLHYLRDPAVAMWRKCAGLAAVAYVVMPFDLIPDFIPVLGWLDDLGVVSLVAAFVVREIRRHSEEQS